MSIRHRARGAREHRIEPTDDNWPFGDLVPLSYGLIMADCAWRFQLYSKKGEKKSAQHHYKTMTVEEICALPVGHLAAPDCLLFFWTTWPMLFRAPEVLDAWGFRYKTGGAWHKRTVRGKTLFGTGYLVRSACEPFLIATLGNPKTPATHRNLIEGLAREHSRKPEEAYEWCQTYMPHVRRCELFARTERPGWDVWGDEVQKFNPLKAGRLRRAACGLPA